MTNTGGYTTTSAADGSFTLVDVTPGIYTVTASIQGYSSQTSSDIAVSIGHVTACDFNLAALPGIASGVVRDGANNPVVGALIISSTGGYSTTTASGGAYSIANVAVERTLLTASKTGYDPQTQSNVVVSPGGSATRDFTIALKVGTISGTVKDALNNAISGASVTTLTGGYTATTNSSGVYTLSNVVLGTYSVTASMSGFNSQTLNNIVVQQNTTTTTNFSLTVQPGTISGFVRNASNAALAGATVSTSTGGYTTTSAADGSYTLSM